MPPFPRKNVHKTYANRDDARYQKYGVQNSMFSHDNPPSADTFPLSRCLGQVGDRSLMRLRQSLVFLHHSIGVIRAQKSSRL
jgi:hypothetical protein